MKGRMQGKAAAAQALEVITRLGSSENEQILENRIKTK
jgi:hypothetical protein